LQAGHLTQLARTQSEIGEILPPINLKQDRLQGLKRWRVNRTNFKRS
jgi:hypothetical protein